MVDQVVISGAIYACIIGMMGMGLTMTYLTTKVPNFAYGSVVAVGMYVSYTLLRFDGVNPYATLPLAFVIGGALSVAVYLLVLRPLTRRGSSIVALMIATLGVDTFFFGLLAIYTDYLAFINIGVAIDDKQFPPLSGDFSAIGLPGLFLVTPLVLALFTAGLYLLLTKTRFGIAMRASVENPSLSRTLGINVERVYMVSWFIAGGIAGVSGPLYAMDLGGGSDVGSTIIVAIFAASVLGGLTSIYGGALGGLVVGASTIIITTYGVELVGSWLLFYEKGIPLVIMIVALLFLPKGLVSLDWRRILGRK